MDADFDHSVYFYTYSTIAQVLAAVFSILVAAVVFRIQEIASRVSHFSTNQEKSAFSAFSVD